VKKQEYSFDGIIWSVKVDHLSDFIALEIRYKDRKEVEFFAIDLYENKKINIHHHFEEKWLWGIECIHNKTIIVHSYLSAQSPEHQYLIAYDTQEGKKLWENYTDAFENINGDHLVVYNLRIEPKKLTLLNIRTGQTEVRGRRSEIGNQLSDLRFPTSDILDWKGYHISTSTKDRSQVIEIINDEKNIHISEIISKDIDTLPLDSFFIFNDHLIFIKNKSRLVTYLLE
jgi:hypothetical protein